MKVQEAPTSGTSAFVHQALIYASTEEFAEAADEYVRDGIEAEEPVLVRVRSENVEALRAALGSGADSADLAPAEGWYETSARTRSKFLAWADRHANGKRIRLLGEPPWPLESEAGIRDWARHEAVINVAFAERPIDFVCPYDASSLPSAVIEHAECTHPQIVRGDGVDQSPRFADPLAYCRRLDRQACRHSDSPLVQFRYGRDDLGSVRRLVAAEAHRAGLGAQRADELMTAVNEVATNALIHGLRPARLAIWREPDELVFEVLDGGGGIPDPLEGQLAPKPSPLGGCGVWIARNFADALEFRSDGSGARVAIHASLPQAAH
jgi:anti-sigma regulatory factor (Ser/Thr protein kinase)